MNIPFLGKSVRGDHSQLIRSASPNFKGIQCITLKQFRTVEWNVSIKTSHHILSWICLTFPLTCGRRQGGSPWATKCICPPNIHLCLEIIKYLFRLTLGTQSGNRMPPLFRAELPRCQLPKPGSRISTLSPVRHHIMRRSPKLGHQQEAIAIIPVTPPKFSRRRKRNGCPPMSNVLMVGVAKIKVLGCKVRTNTDGWGLWDAPFVGNIERRYTVFGALINGLVYF